MDESEKQKLRKNLRLNWLSSLAALGDIQLQQRWIDKKITNPAWSYVEFMCSYFDDSTLSDGGYKEMIRNGFVTQEEYECIKDFHDALDKYKEPNGDYDPLAILQDPRWQKIVALGKQSAAKLATLLTDPREKIALLDPPPALTEKDYTWPTSPRVTMQDVSTLHISRASLREFTFLMAFLMSIIALSIDALLPALGEIGAEFHIYNPNHVQYVIGCIFVGMALGQLLCGPLSDALGRKKILYFGIVVYLIGSVVCLTAKDFNTLLVGRFIQGLGVSGPYVSAISIVRDCYSGRDMARVMSIIMMIFIVVPAIAPSLGQAILFLGAWRDIFWLYIFYAVVIAVWLSLRLEETLPPEKRIPFKVKDIRDGFKEVISNRVTMSYMICMGICFGSFIGYLNSSRQIFQDQFNTGKMFTVYFGLLALILGIASLMNARFVERLGMRYICFRSMLCIVGASAVFLGMHYIMEIQLWMFLLYAAILFFSFGLMFGNLNAIAMEPMGHVAGIASAVTGCISSLISMGLGAMIGQLYNNTLIPIVLGFFTLGVLSLFIMSYADNEEQLA